MNAFDQIRSSGFATVRLDDTEAGFLADLYREASAFFATDVPAKLRHSVPNRVTGYRQYGYANTGPDKPDLNDSFLYWRQALKAVPHSDEIAPFISALEAYRQVAAKITRGVIDEMRSYYTYTRELPFEDASVVQINSFTTPTERELHQYAHEDADFLTVISGSAAGLEVVVDGEIRALKFAPNEVAVMPGSLMTDMTGGDVSPLYHQVRNYGILDRKSIMYFVSPDATDSVEPFKVTDHNRSMDIRERIVSNPQMFGLSEDFLSV